MARRYEQYCPIAHALDVVGERWSLLIVRELLHGPRRYSDLAEALPGIGTNILAARLRALEAAGVVGKRRLPPPAASQVYELTAYGEELRGVVRELARWGARSLGPPLAERLRPGWLADALDVAVADGTTTGRIEFRVGGEVASVVDGVAAAGAAEGADAVVATDADGFHRLLVDGSLEGVVVDGDRAVVERLLPQVVARAPA